jgi:hypothetical protein
MNRQTWLACSNARNNAPRAFLGKTALFRIGQRNAPFRRRGAPERLALLKLDDIGLQIRDHARVIGLRAFPIGARLIPVIDLQGEEHARNHDDELDDDREPILPAYGLAEAAEDHGALPLSSVMPGR